MRIAVIGTGYVGLVTAACLAAKGHFVRCIDLDQSKIDKINAGQTPIHEAGLAELLQETIGDRLVASNNLPEAITWAEVSIIAVGTPTHANEIDLTAIRNAAREIGQALAESPSYHVVIVKSTVVPGTTEEVVLPILESTSGKTAGAAFGVGMNPEFLREGQAVDDFMHPDRIVLGGIDAQSLEKMASIYAPFNNVPIVKTNPRIAETIKYTSNALLATLISFSNEIGNLCTKIGADIGEVMNGLNLDKRWTPILPDGTRLKPAILDYLMAGCGYGGSCFPKDVDALIAYGQKLDVPMRILQSVRETNIAQPLVVLDLAEKLGGCLTEQKIAVLGLAFKPGTDDTRQSPALIVIEKLIELGATLSVYDPIAKLPGHLSKAGACQSVPTLSDALDSADGVMLMTSWPEFSNVPALLADLSPQPWIVDGRRMLEPGHFDRYATIGSPIRYVHKNNLS